MKADALTVLVPRSFDGGEEALLEGLDRYFDRGVEAAVYHSPEEAMQLMSGQRMDLLVLEVGAESGQHRGLLAVAKQARPEIPVVVVVPEGFPLERRRELAHAVFDFVFRPLVKERIFVVLRNAL